MVRFSLYFAVAAAILDRLSKWWLLDVWNLPEHPVEVASFLNVVMVWNPGMSFGLLGSDWPGLPWLLSAVSLAIVCGLVVWLRRVGRRWLAAAIGLVIGGALSNVYDRLAYGAVADFADFHLAGYHWPAFNIADSAIVVGVALILLDTLSGGQERHK